MYFLQVAFWIVKTDTPSRTSLGIITILSVTKIGFGGKTKPKVVMMIRKTVLAVMSLMTMMRNQSEGGLLHRLGHLQHHLLCFYPCCSLRVRSHQLHRDVCSEVYRNQLHRNNHHHHLYIYRGHHDHHQLIIMDQIQGRRGGQEKRFTSGKDDRKGDFKIIMISVFKFPQIFTKNQEPVSRFFLTML